MARLSKGTHGGKRNKNIEIDSERDVAFLEVDVPEITIQLYELPRVVEGIKDEYFGPRKKTITNNNINVEEVRINHIKRHHKIDFDRLMKNMNKTLQKPDIVINSPTVKNAVIFSRKINKKLNQLVVVYLSKTQEQKMWTSYFKTDKQLENYVKRSIILFERGN